jgi:hypothetical protein
MRTWLAFFVLILTLYFILVTFHIHGYVEYTALWLQPCQVKYKVLLHFCKRAVGYVRRPALQKHTQFRNPISKAFAAHITIYADLFSI